MRRPLRRREPAPAAPPPEPEWPPAWAVPVIRSLEESGVLWAMQGMDAADVAPYLTWAPPGHFYSPVPSRREVRRAEERHRAQEPVEAVPGIDLRFEHQLALLRELSAYSDFDPTGGDGRYRVDNDQFGPGDATVLQAMLRHLKPQRVVEIGSGFSSAVMLDTADRHLGDVRFTFVEPYPDRLRSLLTEADLGRVTLHELPVQELPPAVVDELEAGDVLFVDSSHVAKPGSDVCFEVFELLPRLASGVVVHFHDIAFPFEIPGQWLEEGRVWTEVYLLRAFLQYNAAFEVVLFNDMLARLGRDQLLDAFPQAAPNPGLSLWLRRR